MGRDVTGIITFLIQVSLPISKVETVEETKQREAKEMQEKKMKDEAMMELKAAIGGGARPSQA